jgi:hypothetical protein
MDPELESFFDGYRASFADGPKAIAAFYAEPCVTARAGSHASIHLWKIRRLCLPK